MVLTVPLLAADPGVTDKEIAIGSSLALSGPGGYLGTQTNHGMNAYFKSVNEAGGINGRTIKLVAYDDEYNPLKCIENTKKLIETDTVFALSSFVGTPTVGKSMPLWKNAKVPLVGMYTGAEPILRNPLCRYNLHVRAPYSAEASAIVDAAVNNLKFKKVAIFYQYDSFGESIKKNAETALAKYGLTPVAYGTFDKATLDVKAGLAAIKAASPEAVIMVGTYGTHPILATFVKEAKSAGMTQTVFFTPSTIGPEDYAKELGSDAGNCVVSQVVPPYDDPQLSVAGEYKRLLKKYYPGDSPNFVGLEGFVNAKVLVEGIKRAGKDLTREGLVDAIEGMSSCDLGGITVTYGPNDHEGMDKVYLTCIKGGKYTEIKDWTNIK